MEYSFHSKTWSAKEIKDMKIIIILVKDNYTRGKIIIMGNALQEEKNPLKKQEPRGRTSNFHNHAQYTSQHEKSTFYPKLNWILKNYHE